MDPSTQQEPVAVILTRSEIKDAKQKRQAKKLVVIEDQLKTFSSESDEDDLEASSASSKPIIVKDVGGFKIPLPKTAHIVRPNSKKDSRPEAPARKAKDYKEMEEYFGVPMEPFHMRDEKAQRLVDDNDNFLFKNVEREQDSWLQDQDQSKEKIDDSKYETH